MIPEYEAERQIILDTCLLLQKMEYFLGTWGNVSLRVNDHILLTPSRVEYSTMKPSDVVVIDMEGNKLAGDRNPTSEKEVHRYVYRCRQDINAVIHAHTSNAMAVSALEIDSVPCLVEEMSQLLGGCIPLTREYIPAAKHAALGEATGRIIGEHSAIILRNHGPVTCGRNMPEAILCARVVEKACGLYLAVKSSGKAFREIPPEYVESERYRFIHTYGKEKT